MKKIIDFIVWSSVNPEKVSLTVKGFLAMCISIAVPTLTLIGVTAVGNADLTAISAQILSVITDSLTVASGLVTLYGLVRKVYLTLKGENKAL